MQRKTQNFIKYTWTVESGIAKLKCMAKTLSTFRNSRVDKVKTIMINGNKYASQFHRCEFKFMAISFGHRYRALLLKMEKKDEIRMVNACHLQYRNYFNLEFGVWCYLFGVLNIWSLCFAVAIHLNSRIHLQQNYLILITIS